MQCVMCKRGEVRSAVVQAEIKLGSDRLLVPVEAEACAECGKPTTQHRPCATWKQ